MSFKMVRSKLFGQRRLIFSITLSGSEALSPIEVPNYRMVSITSIDMIDDTLKEKFIQRQCYILPNTQTVLSKGGHLWVGYLNGQLANLACTRTGDGIGSYFFPLTAECVLISHCVTFPEYRGHDLYPASLTHIVRTLGNKGFKRFYIDCCDWNMSSERAIRHTGFRLIDRRKCKRKEHLL